MFRRFFRRTSADRKKLQSRSFTPGLKLALVIAILLSIGSTLFFYQRDQLVAYGDSESHLNIAKRVVHSITPGMAQLGGIWLPLPHLMLVPFVAFDPLWRTGLAGAIVSGGSFVIACLFIYKMVWFLTRSRLAAWGSFSIFALNPNILYMQSTAMSELPLIAFFVMSTYFFIKFLHNDQDTMSLILAAATGFAASLTRYDGWFLVLFEALIIILLYVPKLFHKNAQRVWQTMEAHVLLFSSLAFFGIGLWLLWDYLILGDPLYFTSSPFSAKSQQQGWLARGELPTYKNLPLSLAYYTVTATENAGYLMTGLFVVGLLFFAFDRQQQRRWLIMLLGLVPFIFYVVTMYMGQSVIFIPNLTPETFEWQLFNVRYGMMMIPVIAIFSAYLLHRVRWRIVKAAIVLLILAQTGMFFTGRAAAISWMDGVQGLSSARRTDAERWLAENYDQGLVLFDDFSRTISIVRSTIPMQNIIYIGNKPYWDESLEAPEKYATWIVMQENDAVWNNFLKNKDREARLYAHFQKVYTSPTILIFKRAQPVE